MIVLSAPNGGKASDWLRPSSHALYHSALNGGMASDWTKPFPYQREGSELPKGPYQSNNGYSNRVHLLSILPAFPRVGGKLDHVSSQGKEALFAMHDIYEKNNIRTARVEHLHNLYYIRTITLTRGHPSSRCRFLFELTKILRITQLFQWYHII